MAFDFAVEQSIRAAAQDVTRATPYDSRVTIYFIRCKTCQGEIRLEGGFSKVFQAFLNCPRCGKRHPYIYNDIEERRETDAATQL